MKSKNIFSFGGCLNHRTCHASFRTLGKLFVCIWWNTYMEHFKGLQRC